MASMIQKLIQEDIKTLEARYGKDAVLAAVTDLYLLVDRRSMEQKGLVLAVQSTNEAQEAMKTEVALGGKN